MTEIVEGLGRPERDRVTALRSRGEFFWIDVSLKETELADLGKALEIPERALHQLASDPTHRGSREYGSRDTGSMTLHVRASVGTS